MVETLASGCGQVVVGADGASDRQGDDRSRHLHRHGDDVGTRRCGDVAEAAATTATTHTTAPTRPRKSLTNPCVEHLGQWRK